MRLRAYFSWHYAVPMFGNYLTPYVQTVYFVRNGFLLPL
jgi:hypothetical protein